MFDYSKYENASLKQIIQALTASQKKAERLSAQMKENKEVFNFLKNKLKEHLLKKKKKNNSTKEK